MLVLIAQALGDDKAGVQGRLAMTEVCVSWNWAVAKTPVLWEPVKKAVVRLFRKTPQHFYPPKRMRALKERFGVTLTDLLATDIDILESPYLNLMHSLAARGDYATLGVLSAHFGFTAEHARTCDNIALQTAVREGHVDFLEALAGTYGLGAEDARACKNRALFEAVQQDNVDVVRMLFERFGLGLEDVQGSSTDIHHGYYFVWWASAWPSPRSMLALMAMYGLPGVAARARDWQERAAARNDSNFWWPYKHNCNIRLFYELFLEEYHKRLEAEIGINLPR